MERRPLENLNHDEFSFFLFEPLFAERAHHSIEHPQDSSTFENMSDKTKDTRINITSNPISSDLSSSERSSSRSRPHRHRLLHKNGKVNLRPYRVPLKKERFLADFFTSIIDAKWRWVIAIYSAGFIFSWSFFGTAWFAIFWLRLHYDNGTVCVDNVDSWTSAFLFSVETQTTIGYGGRQITPQCPEAVICLLLQSLTGFLLSTSLLGLVFAKLSRPRPRGQTVIFSKHAVVAPYDGLLSLMFRVGDARKSQLLDVAISLHCFCFRTTKTGEEILFSQTELPITTEHGSEVGELIKPFLLLPLTVVHVIDERSPLYELGPQELANSRMEFIAVLEGVVESTSMVTQAKTSFLADEIRWGRRFLPISLHRDNRTDLSSFDTTYKVKTPQTSPKEYERSNRKKIKHQEYENTATEKTKVETENGDCHVSVEPINGSSTVSSTTYCQKNCNGDVAQT